MEERNKLFPVFVKLEDLETLIVGGGTVALEKLRAVLRSSPAAGVTIVAAQIHDEIRTIAAGNKRIKLVERRFRVRDLQYKDLAILATDDVMLHQRIRTIARKRRILINVADTPALCDFYLGSVVNKGSVTIGISTNGKSPTMAKRFREYFEEVLPAGLEDVLTNMNGIRETIKGDLAEKVRVLNEVTAAWLRQQKEESKK